MSDVVMIEAALFQLRTAAADVDPMYRPQLDLCTNVLSNAVEAARDGVNPARVSDMEFAVNDLAGAVDELPQADADRIGPLLTMLRNDIDALKAATALDPAIVTAIRTLQAKLRERMKAMERQTFVEGGSDTPLPHRPEELLRDAIPLARHLFDAGFATPMLDAFLADPHELRFHMMRELIDELDVIAG